MVEICSNSLSRDIVKELFLEISSDDNTPVPTETDFRLYEDAFW